MDERIDVKEEPVITPQAERTFTQDEVSRLCTREAAKAERGILRALGLENKEEIQSLSEKVKTALSASAALNGVTSERDDYKAKYEAACAELESLQNRSVLAKHGVTGDDESEFYLFKLGKMVDESKNFAAVAEEYFASHPTRRTPVQLTAPVQTSTPSAENQKMNDIIRGFRK